VADPSGAALRKLRGSCRCGVLPAELGCRGVHVIRAAACSTKAGSKSSTSRRDRRWWRISLSASGTCTPRHPSSSGAPPCAGQTGMVKGMKESDGEGIATHTGPAPCADARKGEGEASARVRAGQVLSREIPQLRDADAVEGCGRRKPARRYRETQRSPARSQTLCTLGITMLGNREIPGLPAGDGTAGRVGKPKGEIRR